MDSSSIKVKALGKVLSFFSFNPFFYAGLLLLILIPFILGSAADVSAEAQLSGCTGKITGVTTLGNTNAGQTSFDAHENATGGNEGITDLSITGESATGLAPANLEDAACNEEQAGTLSGTAYDYALKGWAWNTNLGFLSFNCQSGRNDAGSGIGIACGGINYGVYLSEPDGSGNRDLIGHAWSPSFGWLQFNGSGNALLSSGELQMDVGETENVTLGGSAYAVLLIDNAPTGASWISVNGSSTKIVAVGETVNFGSVNLTALASGYQEGPSPHLTFRLDKIISSGSRSVNVGATTVVGFDGASYEVSLDGNTPPGASHISINGGAYQWVGEGTIAQFGDVYLNAVDSKYMEGPFLPHLTFELQKVDDEDFDYSVVRDSDGDVTGSAWTSAGVWLPFSGIKIYLPDETPPEVDDASCEDHPWVCVSIEIDAAGTKIADGTDGYYVDLYLKDSDGVSALSAANFSNLDEFLDSLNFVWEDTVKLDQLPAASGSTNAVGDDLNDVANPWDFGSGAITFKPMNFADFAAVSGDPGHYRSIAKVASYAPTSGGNLSYTSGTDPVYAVNNERPVYEDLTTRLEGNRLSLSRVEFDSLLNNSGLPAFTPVPIYPNGQVNLPLEFRPAVSVDDLYVGDFQDQIVGYRGVVENISTSMKFVGSLPAAVRSSAEVDFELSYSDEETRASGGSCATSDSGEPVFDYNFITGSAPSTTLTRSASSLTTTTDFQILASLPVSSGDSEVALPCAVAASPSLKTTVSYTYEGNDVAYLSNHLPRIAQEGIYNPAVVIHGTVLSQLVGDVQAGKSIDTSGYVNVNKVRDTVNENLEKYLGDVNLRNDGICIIDRLNTVSGFAPAAATSSGSGAGGGAKFSGTLSGILRGIVPEVTTKGTDSGGSSGGSDDKVAPISTCINRRHYVVFQVGNENVFYTKDNDVTLDLGSGVWNNSWVVISDGGNIFIDGNTYDPSDANAKLAMVTFRDSDNYAATGNIYVHPDVLNLQATIVADGTVFSYNGDHADINANGEPIWASHADMMDTNSNQLKCDCAIFSRNTIGGADLDQGNNPKNYLLLGGGEVLELPVDLNARMRAQQYDLNYLRTFRTVLERSGSGLPIDQKCYRPLTTEDVVAIANGETLCGDRGTCDVAGSASQAYACDGINPLRRYNLTNISGLAAGPDGDLVSPSNITGLAHGLDNSGEGATDFDPVYVFYTAPSKNSFLFSKAGTLSIN